MSWIFVPLHAVSQSLFRHSTIANKKTEEVCGSTKDLSRPSLLPDSTEILLLVCPVVPRTRRHPPKEKHLDGQLPDVLFNFRREVIHRASRRLSSGGGCLFPNGTPLFPALLHLPGHHCALVACFDECDAKLVGCNLPIGRHGSGALVCFVCKLAAEFVDLLGWNALVQFPYQFLANILRQIPRAVPLSPDAAQVFDRVKQLPRPAIGLGDDFDGRTGRLIIKAQRSGTSRSEEHTSELQSLRHLVCRLL